MVDRIDIGMGPRLGFDPTDTGGFKYVGQKELTQEEYGSRKVNFYNQYLGLPGLGEESDIEVGAPEIGDEIKPEEQDSVDESEAVTNVLRDPTFTDGEATTGASSIKYGADAYKNYTSEYATYSEYLRNNGQMDRVNLVSGIYEPFTKGNYRDIDLSVLGVEAREGIQAVRDAPQTLSEEFAELREEGFAGVKKRVAEGIPKAMAGVFAMAGLGTVGSLLTGDTVKNAFGATSFRPSGPLGVVSDLVHAKQYEDMTQIRAAESAARGMPGDMFKYSDTGFAMQFGSGMGITRRPGARGYTGNLQGMSVNQIKDLEALSKGFIPKSYRFSGKAGLTDFGDFKANVSVEDSGGVFTDPNNRLKGFYTADGKYYTPGVGYSKYANAADRNRLAKSEFGWTTKAEQDRMQDIINDARAGKGKLADLIQAEKNKIAADRAEQRRQDEQRRADEAQRQRNIEAGRQRLAGDFYDSDDEGPTISSSGPSRESSFDNVDDFEGLDPDEYAAGGTVGMAVGGIAAGMGSGFVDRPPSQVPEEQTVADDVETQMPEGAFVINAAAVEFAGEQDIKKMLNDAQKEAVRRGITIDNSENSTKLIDVAISRGEVTVAPYLAKIIGYDRLKKINNRGKPETKERLQEAAQGGMLDRPGYASGDKVTVYRGEPIDPNKAQSTIKYGYDDTNVGKFHTPSVDKARRYAVHGGPGNQQILSRKVTIDELFEGVEEAWKVNASKKNEYFSKMPKKELNKNVRFIRNMKKAYETGERSLESMVMFLQEQVFHDDKSKVNFIETFKNDPKSAGKLAGRAISKVATKATPPLAILEMVGTVFAPKTMGDATLQGDESFLNTNLSATR